jgi:hypothetical protein
MGSDRTSGESSGSGRRRLGFVALCLLLGLASTAIGDSIARDWFFASRLSPLETLRADGGQYVVNGFLTEDYDPDAVTAVVFGDSANDSVPDRDEDRRFITQMLSDRLEGQPITVFPVSFPGNAPDWISSQLRYLLYRYPGIDYAVIPLNLRWISPVWRAGSSTTARREAYELYAAGPLRWILGSHLAFVSPKGFDPKQQPVETVIGPKDAAKAALSADEYLERYGGRLEDARRVIHRLRIAVSYGFRLGDDDPLFSLIDRLAADCAANRLRCLFYLPPYNLEFIEQTSAEVLAALEGNIDKVRRYAAMHGLRLLDLSATLSNEHFHDRVNEHVDQVGRQLIAGCLAEVLTAWHDAGPPGPSPLSCTRTTSGDFAVSAGPVPGPAPALAPPEPSS